MQVDLPSVDLMENKRFFGKWMEKGGVHKYEAWLVDLIANAERRITEEKYGDELYDLAEEVEDKATMNMLHWFIEEQVEEEASVDAVVQKLKMAEGALSTLFRLDAKLGEREE